MSLSSRKNYLQIALNSSLTDAYRLIMALPLDERIIWEVGTPLLKEEGKKAIVQIKQALKVKALLQGKPEPYLIADMKTIDRAEREIMMVKQAGAHAIIMMASSPIETLTRALEVGKDQNIDIFLDMMNIEFPLSILRKLPQSPAGVYLHRGVDETAYSKNMLPLHEIRRILGEKDMLIGVAGGDSQREIQSTIFNDAHIVVLWQAMAQSTSRAKETVQEVLKSIR